MKKLGEIYDKYKLSRQTSKINPPETLDKNLDYQTQGLDYQTQGLDYEELIPSQEQLTNSPFTGPNLSEDAVPFPNGTDINDLGLFKKRKIIEVPLMDDDLEEVLNRTKEINYKLIEDLIEKGIEKFEFASQTVPNDIYVILFMSKGKKKWFAVLQNDNEDIFILDMNSLFIVNAIPNSNNSPSVEEGFNPKKNRDDAPRKPSIYADKTDIEINNMVTFLYKGDEKRVLVKESNDKYLEGICQEQNKYKKYLVRYIERPRVSLEKVVSYRETLGLSREPPVYSSDEDTKDLGSDTDIDIDASDEGLINMPYKRMVLNAIKDMYVNGTRGSSRQAIQAYLLANYNHHINESRFQDNLRRTLKRLVETGCIVQNKQKFKLGDEGRMYLKKITLKELKPVKKGNPVQAPQPNKIQSKHDLIQYAIDNEKILDIMYDGGSIPDIKRPIRPKRVFMTSYTPKKEILEAICLIDDKVKYFTLDKVTVITFIEE